MLKIDKLRVDRLLSSDVVVSEAAARELSDTPIGHFEDHPIDKKFVLQRAKRLIALHRTTNSAIVQEWIVQLLAESGYVDKDSVHLLTESISPDCPYLPNLLYAISQHPGEFSHAKARIKKLIHHENAEVRWRSGFVLSLLSLKYKEDIQTIRRLMLDKHQTTQHYGFICFARLRESSILDKIILIGIALRYWRTPVAKSAYNLLLYGDIHGSQPNFA